MSASPGSSGVLQHQLPRTAISERVHSIEQREEIVRRLLQIYKEKSVVATTVNRAVRVHNHNKNLVSRRKLVRVNGELIGAPICEEDSPQDAAPAESGRHVTLDDFRKQFVLQNGKMRCAQHIQNIQEMVRRYRYLNMDASTGRAQATEKYRKTTLLRQLQQEVRYRQFGQRVADNRAQAAAVAAAAGDGADTAAVVARWRLDNEKPRFVEVAAADAAPAADSGGEAMPDAGADPTDAMMEPVLALQRQYADFLARLDPWALGAVRLGYQEYLRTNALYVDPAGYDYQSRLARLDAQIKFTQQNSDHVQILHDQQQAALGECDALGQYRYLAELEYRVQRVYHDGYDALRADDQLLTRLIRRVEAVRDGLHVLVVDAQAPAAPQDGHARDELLQRSQRHLERLVALYNDEAVGPEHLDTVQRAIDLEQQYQEVVEQTDDPEELRFVTEYFDRQRNQLIRALEGADTTRP